LKQSLTVSDDMLGKSPREDLRGLLSCTTSASLCDRGGRASGTGAAAGVLYSNTIHTVSSDNLPSYHPDNHHSSDDVC